MTESPPSAGAATPATRNSALRIRAIPVLVLLFAEILVGNQLAEVGTPYPWGYLAAHIALSLVLIALTAHAFVLSLHLPSGAARATAGITFLTTLGATVSGTVFLVAGQNPSALYGMEGLGGVALLGAILLLVVGSVSIPNSPSKTA